MTVWGVKNVNLFFEHELKNSDLYECCKRVGVRHDLKVLLDGIVLNWLVSEDSYLFVVKNP